jgi:hypothetical protein|uniref:Uncharacterized protein n=1 Tax=Populus trichocarpa TaxID=3694 RepID=A0A2K1YHC3_POPTR
MIFRSLGDISYDLQWFLPRKKRLFSHILMATQVLPGIFCKQRKDSIYDSPTPKTKKLTRERREKPSYIRYYRPCFAQVYN